MPTQSWSDGLTPEQQRAASFYGTHARLLAGPGTGKTHTLARHVVYLATREGVPPSEMLVLTFTRMATRALKSTIRKELSPYSAEMPYISTLHGFALRQLRKNADLVHSLPQPLRIADDWEESMIIHEELKGVLTRHLPTIKRNFGELAADWQTLKADGDEWETNLGDPAFVGAWQEQRRIYGYVMRSELVYQLKRAMEQIPDFALEPSFKHMLIDEYQDLNPCDLAIASEGARRGLMLLASGDDDQSIYGFRFADPSGIRDFTSDFAGAGDLVLTECRRCDEEILRAAKWVAEQDVDRVPKELNATEGHVGGEVQLLSFRTGNEESDGVARLVKKLIEEGTKPSEILVLVRSDNNSVLSRPLAEALTLLRVPVTSSVERRTVLDEAHGRRLLTMLRLVANRRDHLAWRTRLKLQDGLGPRTAAPIYAFARREGITYSDAIHRLNEYAEEIPSQQLPRLHQLLQSTNNTADLLKALLERLESENGGASSTTLLEVITEAASTEIIEEDGRAEVVAFVENAINAGGISKLDDLFASLSVDHTEGDPELDTEKVNILTMHQAKGLTTDVVFIISAED